MPSPSSLDQLALAVVSALSRAVAECERALPTTRRPVDVGAAEARLGAGIPALHGERLLGEPPAAGAALLADVRRVADALASLGEPVAAAAGTVAGALGAPRAGVDLDGLAADALAGEWDSARTLAPRLDVDEDALVTVLDYAARAPLRAAAAALRPLLARRAWARGTCPACGAPPLLAELRGKDRLRVLRCARCDASWEFPRGACPSCGERDHRKLTALHGEGEESYRRADCCDTCHGYVKAVATLDAYTPEALLRTDLETAALDWAAVERGYHR